MILEYALVLPICRIVTTDSSVEKNGETSVGGGEGDRFVL